MKIYDCTNYFNEDLMYGLRLEILDKYVDKFVVAESKYTHSGQPKKLHFDINRYSKFKNKIIYIVVEDEPSDLIDLSGLPTNQAQGMKRVNSLKRIKQQYDILKDGIGEANDNDLIILSDCDEIPNLTSLGNFKLKKILIFEQLLFYYKFNLYHNSKIWHGSKACLKKDLVTFNQLRNIKNKKYPLWRIDTLFSKNKYNNVKFVDNGGWHFTNMKTPEEIFSKLNSFLHNVDFKLSGLNLDDVKEMVSKKKIGYDHFADQRKVDRWNSQITLKAVDISILPKYISDNKEKFKDWLEL